MKRGAEMNGSDRSDRSDGETPATVWLGRVLLIVAVLLAGDAAAAKPWLTSSQYGDVFVVVGDGTTVQERFAAQEFVELWEQSTGHDAILSDRPGPATNVWVGPDGVPDDLLRKLELEGLGPDGLCIRTVGDRDLLLIGGRPRGTIYAVYEFFERYMGVRWFTPDLTHFPEPPEEIPRINHRYVPPFAWRDVSYRAFIENPRFALAHRLNGQHARIPEDWGGNIGFANGFGHTFFSFVNPDEFLEIHPEYFSEIEGERSTVRNATQICLANGDVLRIVVEKTREILRNSPSNRRIVSVTQMDWPFWCECETCSAIDEQEGSHSGTMIHFVNRVAEAIEEEFPDAFIDTFAYTYTRKPPKHVKPRDNVIVRLCSIECDFSKPFSDRSSPHNRAFQKDIKAWSKITKNLYVWDYTQNWWCHQQPHPNIHVLQPNVEFFAKSGVVGLFEQSSPISPHSDYELLKGYILGRSVWNPEVDWQQLYAEFLEHYYAEAAPFIREYHDLITKRVLDTGYLLGFLSHAEWMDYEMVLRAEAIFERAFATAEDEAVRERLKYAHLPVQYAALTCPPRIEQQGAKYILTRPPSQTFDEYWDMITEYGVTMLEDRPISYFRDRLDGKTPPRREEISVETLENDAYTVSIAPTAGGRIIQFRDNRQDVELFARHVALLTGRWCCQEWDVMDPDDPKIEEPVEGNYELVGRTDDSVTVQVKLDNGLLIRRTMRLAQDSSPFEVVVEFENTGTESLVPRVKLHPEIWLQGENRPELWVERDGAWSQHEIDTVQDGLVGLKSVDPAGVTRWAAYITKKRLAVINTVAATPLDNLFFFMNIPKQHVNLELVPDLSPLAPGESRVVRAIYEIRKGRPRKWQ